MTNEPNRPNRYLFVSGCPRSGTTVMATLLNWSDSVLIGQERYAPLVRFHPDQFGPHLFEPQRMLTFVKGDCGYASFENMKEYSAHYANPKNFEAISDYPIRGDKITRLYEHLGNFDGPEWEGEDVTVLHMIRNPVEVACSYETRKLTATDRWQDGYEAGIEDWTNAVDRVHEYMLEGGNRIRLGIVSYDHLFLGGVGGFAESVAKIYDFAGLEFGDKQMVGVEKVHKASHFFMERRKRHQQAVDAVNRDLSEEKKGKYQFLLERRIRKGG